MKPLRKYIVAAELEEIIELVESCEDSDKLNELRATVIEALCSMNWDRTYALESNQATITFKFPKAYLKYFTDKLKDNIENV